MATSMVYKVNKHINAVCLQRMGTKSVSPEKQPLFLPVARTHTTEIFVRSLPRDSIDIYRNNLQLHT